MKSFWPGRERNLRVSAFRSSRWAAALAASLLLCSGCYRENAADAPGEAGRGTESSSEPLAPAVALKRPPIVLISIDTLRSDHLPAYGYDRVETPAIDALRRDGVLYEHAYSHAPTTLPAHASLLTGQLPPAHGVRDNAGYRLDATGRPFLPQRLKELGYATGGAVSVFLLHRSSGLGEGYDFYEDRFVERLSNSTSGVQRPGSETLERSRDWLRSVADRSFFFFFHLYEPHAPYTPPEPFASRFASAYDGEIAAADHVVGELLDELRRLGVYEQALILLLSDHGEGLLDHGEREHGVLLYRESLQVPLIVKWPGNAHAGASVAQPAQLIDVYPTVLELLGERPGGELRGGSLRSLLDGEAPPRVIYAETFYPRLHFGWSDLASLIEYPWQYIEGPDPELYDLVEDPAQKHNRLEDERRVYRSLRDALAGFDRTLEPPSQAALSEETLAALSALGYVGTAGPVADGADLPDPKAQLPTLETFERGLASLERGDLTAAIEAFRRAVAENPLMIDGWESLGDALSRAGDLEAAYETYVKALELSGHASRLAVKAASVLGAMGRWEAVRRLTEEELVHSPDDVRLHFIASRSLLFLGRTQEALAAAERALTLEPQNADAHYQRGSVLMGLQQLEAAERDLSRALELAPDHPAAMSDLAVLLKFLGRKDEAKALLRRLLELQPDHALAEQQLRELERG